ncbi:hypothetical protein [Xanthomonas citri]|uniref:hypothetical protein n=1 Tax=Xanthomonas citri TaxID=346 RepID=UPI0001CED385|nr:hypothetical protein [Xanthomonas citri]AMV00040.1 hypothetical protein TP37_19630 [Xanthomonas citri pv. aurantifolii]AMV02132.1 hypothetical protein TP50_06505 [Xanthomonas citri pv. aurantifolii]EFF47871.1 hypothetical protein XAUC_17250 [Xanthomonas citri pv. aurantifolii str. ICPB 10535]MCC8492127.1 hypothetical protein [Xanthomonas citri pv. fuscans]TBW92932.1 hypothetical protein TP49_23505 [Xanthomonas citri pv. aurantifolii]
MTTFLRVKDEATNAVLLEVTDQPDSDLLTQHMGAVSIASGASGSVAVPITGSANQLYYWFVADSSAGNALLPILSDNGNAISWSSPDSANTARVGGTLYYGRF